MEKFTNLIIFSYKNQIFYKTFNCFKKIFCYKSPYEKRHTSKLPYNKS